jgi:hypothetical protein
MSPLVLSTMANNSLCSASGILNFAIVAALFYGLPSRVNIVASPDSSSASGYYGAA